MAEQSLRERIHHVETRSENRRAKLMLLFGGLVGLAAAAFLGWANGVLWAVPGLIVAAACLWGLFARGGRI